MKGYGDYIQDLSQPFEILKPVSPFLQYCMHPGKMKRKIEIFLFLSRQLERRKKTPAFLGDMRS